MAAKVVLADLSDQLFFLALELLGSSGSVNFARVGFPQGQAMGPNQPDHARPPDCAGHELGSQIVIF